jgi:predicted anti-sigma-YlaC factor YlaD
MKNPAALKSACKDFEEDLVLYYYGEGSAAERQRVDHHVSDCTCCRLFVDDLQRLLPHMTESRELPQIFWDNYFRETVAKLADQEEKNSWWRSLVAPMQSWWLPAFGTVAIALLAFGLVLGKGKLTKFIDGSAASLPQEVLADGEQLEFFKSLEMLESLNRLEEKDDGQIKPKPTQSNLENIDPAMA